MPSPSCPLIEITHFHKVLRKEMESLVENFSKIKKFTAAELSVSDKEFIKRSRNQFFLFFSVFKAHAAAEDDTIWPALRLKNAELSDVQGILEDHTGEEERFQEIARNLHMLSEHIDDGVERVRISADLDLAIKGAYENFLQHLDREEAIVHPLIQNNMSHEEMEHMVGLIMGHRSSEMMEVILKMMVRNLSEEDKDFMLGSMQAAVKDTYFEKWLSFLSKDLNALAQRRISSKTSSIPNTSKSLPTTVSVNPTVPITELNEHLQVDVQASPYSLQSRPARDPVATAEEEERRRTTLIGALSLIATCNGLSSDEKARVMSALSNSNVTIATVPTNISTASTVPSSHTKRPLDTINHAQKMIKSSSKEKLAYTVINHDHNHHQQLQQPSDGLPPSSQHTPHSIHENVMIITAADRQPSYRPNTDNKIFGCPHYRRGCKLISPCCGRVFTCRLCHDEYFENAHSLDRSVST